MQKILTFSLSLSFERKHFRANSVLKTHTKVPDNMHKNIS